MENSSVGAENSRKLSRTVHRLVAQGLPPGAILEGWIFTQWRWLLMVLNVEGAGSCYRGVGIRNLMKEWMIICRN